jgi:hypothetical protein
MIKALNKLSFDESEFSLLQDSFIDNLSSIIFYQDDILEKHKSFENQFFFLKDHFLSRIKWFKLKLSFKKLYLFQKIVKALKITHIVEDEIRILSDQCEKIVNFSMLITLTEVWAFLRIIKIIKRWLLNFSKLKKSLTRFIEKMNWRWTSSKQLSFENSQNQMLSYHINSWNRLFRDDEFLHWCVFIWRRTCDNSV